MGNAGQRLSGGGEHLLRVMFLLLLCYISFIPFYYLPTTPVRLGTHVVFLPLLKYLPFGFCALIIATVAWLYRSCAVPNDRRQRFVVRSLALFLVASGLSSLLSEVPAVGLGKWVYFSLTGVGLYLACLPLSVRMRSALITSMVHIAGVVSVYGVMVYLLKEDPILTYVFTEYSNPYYMGVSRISSTLGNPIVLGSFLILILPFLLCGSPAKIPRLNWFYLVFVALGIILTYSRSAWFSAVVVLLVWGAYCGATVLRKALAAPLCGVLWALVVLFGMPAFFQIARTVIGERATATIAKPVNARLTDLEKDQADFLSTLVFPTPNGPAQPEATHSNRVAQYLTTASILREHPLVGIGLGHYTLFFDRYKDASTPPSGGSIGEARTAENMYLMIAAETGMLGIASFLLLIVSIGYNLLSRFFGNPPEDRHLAIGFVASYFAFLVNMLFWDALNHPVNRMVFWIIAGLGSAQAPRAPQVSSV